MIALQSAVGLLSLGFNVNAFAPNASNAYNLKYGTQIDVLAFVMLQQTAKTLINTLIRDHAHAFADRWEIAPVLFTYGTIQVATVNAEVDMTVSYLGSLITKHANVFADNPLNAMALMNTLTLQLASVNAVKFSFVLLLTSSITKLVTATVVFNAPVLEFLTLEHAIAIVHYNLLLDALPLTT